MSVGLVTACFLHFDSLHACVTEVSPWTCLLQSDCMCCCYLVGSVLTLNVLFGYSLGTSMKTVHISMVSLAWHCYHYMFLLCAKLPGEALSIVMYMFVEAKHCLLEILSC